MLKKRLLNSQVMAACDTLSFAARHSREVCVLVAQGGGLAALVAFMQSCNRSKVCA